ncbi:splicing factor SR family RNA-binding protein [Burkholderia sp. WAC0059]|uniref:splicing factor SR family RNA-binding protein n=1 Tax=Burkholderia sp. WAC0059 TaxID=2066022 RepID=UPI0021558433|nr:splicing factor SR family RNA-binding protein [Burkholderia sp. WAC0059]
MHLTVWNIPESCSEQDVRSFFEQELGHYAKSITVYDVGTSNAHADLELQADVPYVAEAVARELQGRRFAGVALRVSAAPFDPQSHSSSDTRPDAPTSFPAPE